MDKAKKKQLKKIVTWALLAALVAGLAAMPLLAKKEAEADGPVASVLSGKVEEGSIQTTLRGGGNLEVEDTENIRIPTGVKITEFLVKNGDRVTEGTPLAAVDKVSVMTAITSVKETMDYLQVEMRTAKTEKVPGTISATAGGRIKKVYAQQGDDVQRVMLEHGALALLSLDGLMAVKIERKMELPTGQSVEVILSDKTEITGRVESNLSGEIVITVEDNGYNIGEKVTVITNDGERVGTGELYVHNAWEVTAYSGTISTVQAKEETKVTSGSTLFTLTDTDYRGDLEYLAALHREYEKLMQDLFKMYNSGTIDSPCTGMVSGVDKDSAHLLSSSEETGAYTNLLATEENGWTLVLVSNVSFPCGTMDCTQDGNHTETCPRNVCTQNTECTANADKHDSACIHSCSKSNSCSGTGLHYSDCIKSCKYDATTQTCPGTKFHKNECLMSCVHANLGGKCGTKTATDPHYQDCVYSCKEVDGTKGCPATKHQLNCIYSCTKADTADKCPATTRHYVDCIKCCVISQNGNEVCPSMKHNALCYFYGMTYKAKVAKVDAVGNTQLVVRWDASGAEYAVKNTSSGWKFENPKDYNAQNLVNRGQIAVGNPDAYKVGDVILVLTGYRGKSPEWNGIAIYSRTATSGGAAGGLAGKTGMTGMAGMGSFGGMGGTTGMTSNALVDASRLFDLNGSVLLTVTRETTAALSITVDEHDIAKAYVGQKATIRIQALGKEAFEAEVVEISNHGENNGGHSKFSVKLRFAKNHDMIDGMSATAILELDNHETVLVIPVAALEERESKTIIYTAQDEKTGEPSNSVEVTIGASDGENVQILEGLSLGDTYYYSYYDTVEIKTAAK